MPITPTQAAFLMKCISHYVESVNGLVRGEELEIMLDSVEEIGRQAFPKRFFSDEINDELKEARELLRGMQRS